MEEKTWMRKKRERKRKCVRLVSEITKPNDLQTLGYGLNPRRRWAWTTCFRI